MTDSLFLSLWFPGFEPEEMMPRTAAILRQFPFSPARPGVSYVSVQPLDWSQPSVLEQRFVPPASPEDAVEAVRELVHDDYAISLEAMWDLWTPDANGKWLLAPSKVQMTAHGKQFDEGTYTEEGHLLINFGLDSPFLYQEMDLDGETEERVKSNVAKLIEFTRNVERNCQITGRVLWSESTENLAQKLIARLQGVQ